MDGQTIFWLAGIAIAILLCAAGIYSVYKMTNPPIGNCGAIKSNDPDTKWNSDCSAIQEIKADSSIKTPDVPLYLSSFTSSPALGPAWGVNVWYRYRYVNGTTGGYGGFSPWTKSAISSGSSTLPCKNSTWLKHQDLAIFGGSQCPSGKSTCQANLPQLTLDSFQYPITSNFYANVHRYVAQSSDTTPPTATSQDQLVGMLVPNGKGGAIFFDISASPCTVVPCSNVQGC
jgi:hypothetical protein